MQELLEWLRSALESPERLLVRLWVLWWIYSSIRNALRKRRQAGEASSPEAAPPAPERPAPAAQPVPPLPQPKAARPPKPTGGLAEQARSLVRRASEARADLERAARARASAPPALPVRSAAAAKAAARSDEREAIQRGLARAYALRTQIAAEPRLARLEPVVDEQCVQPLQAALADRGRVESGAEAPARSAAAARERAEAAAEGRTGPALRMLEVLDRIVAERAIDAPRSFERAPDAPEAQSKAELSLERAARGERERNAARLFEADAIAEACHAPLRRYADAEDLRLRGRHPLAITLPLPQAASARQVNEQLVLLPVPRDFGSELDGYVNLLHELGRRWFFAWPKLAQRTMDQLDLAPRMRLPERAGYTEASVHAAFGPWLPALFAETAQTLRLGEAYVAGLVQSTRAEQEVTRARAEGESMSPLPPTLLRLQVALTSLSKLGKQRSAERQRDAFTAAHPQLEQSYLPLADGRSIALPTAYLLAITDRIARFLLEMRDEALGGVPLLELPFALSLEDAQEQERLAARLSHGSSIERADPALLIGAAFLAWQQGATPDSLLARLHAVLAPPRARSSLPAPSPGAAMRASAQGPASLAAALRDPRALRSAIVLGAAFEPPRSRGVNRA